jgi:hypothetical protein
MGQWPLAIGQRVAPAEQPWGPIRRDGCLRVLARTGRADCRRSCASFPPFSGSIAMSILNIEWYYCHVDIVRGALANARAARSSGCASKSVGTRKSSSYLARRLATAGLQLAAVMMMCIRIIQRCTRGRFVPTLALWRASCSYRPAAVLARKCSKCCQLFRAFRGLAFLRGMVQPYFSVGSLGSRRGSIKIGRLTQWASSFGISWCIRSLVKKTLHCRRAGFEPQRTSSFRKRVRAHQVLGEAVRARTTIPHFVLTL